MKREVEEDAVDDIDASSKKGRHSIILPPGWKRKTKEEKRKEKYELAKQVTTLV